MIRRAFFDPTEGESFTGETNLEPPDEASSAGPKEWAEAMEHRRLRKQAERGRLFGCARHWRENCVECGGKR